MPKLPTFPTIIEDLLQIDIYKLRKWSKQAECTKHWCGVVTWSNNNNVFAKVYAECLWSEQRIILRYTCDGKDVEDTFILETIESNLKGGGTYYQFIKPVKCVGMCSKLYLYNGHFVEREAIHCGMYQAQTESKQWRKSEWKMLLRYDRMEQDDMKTKYVMYNGKETRKTRAIRKREEKLYLDLQCNEI